jgi:hypothetical protein
MIYNMWRTEPFLGEMGSYCRSPVFLVDRTTGERRDLRHGMTMCLRVIQH